MSAFGFPFLLIAGGFSAALVATGVRAIRGRADPELPAVTARRVGIGFVIAGILSFAVSLMLSAGAFGPIRQSDNF